jgi:hypothetical protein
MKQESSNRAKNSKEKKEKKFSLLAFSTKRKVKGAKKKKSRILSRTDNDEIIQGSSSSQALKPDTFLSPFALRLTVVCFTTHRDHLDEIL